MNRIRRFGRQDRPIRVARSIDSLDLIASDTSVDPEDIEETSLWHEIPVYREILMLDGPEFGALKAQSLPVFAREAHKDPWADFCPHYTREVTFYAIITRLIFELGVG